MTATVSSSCGRVSTLSFKSTYFLHYHSEKTVNRVISDTHLVHVNEIAADLYKVKSLKKKIRQDLPIQVRINVYLNSKLHMLKFFYLFLKKYIPDRCFELLESDTDLLCFSISRQSLNDCFCSG